MFQTLNSRFITSNLKRNRVRGIYFAEIRVTLGDLYSHHLFDEGKTLLECYL